MRGKGGPCQFFHPRRGIRLMVHGDDFVSAAAHHQLHWFQDFMNRRFECKHQILGPGASHHREITVLGRRIRWEKAGITYEADDRHVPKIVEALGIQNAKTAATPMVKDEEEEVQDASRRRGGEEEETSRRRGGEEEESEPGEARPGGKTMRKTSSGWKSRELGNGEARKFRSIVARCNYLASDRPDIQFATRVCSAGMATPSELDWTRLKRLGRYLLGRPSAKCWFEWQDMPRGFSARLKRSRVTGSNGWNRVEPETWMRLQTDSDFAGNRKSRKSVSAGTLFFGAHLLRSWSKEQTTIALSSGEAELYAASYGGQQAMGLQTMARDLGIDTKLQLEVDASAAIGIMERHGLGKMRHLDVNELWIQDKVRTKQFALLKVPGFDNTADIGTKPLDNLAIERHMRKMVFY